MEQILINLVAGALGGVGIGKSSPTFDLGMIGNTISGLVGGGVLGQIITLLVPYWCRRSWPRRSRAISVLAALSHRRSPVAPAGPYSRPSLVQSRTKLLPDGNRPPSDEARRLRCEGRRKSRRASPVATVVLSASDLTVVLSTSDLLCSVRDGVPRALRAGRDGAPRALRAVRDGVPRVLRAARDGVVCRFRECAWLSRWSWGFAWCWVAGLQRLIRLGPRTAPPYSTRLVPEWRRPFDAR